MLSTYYASARQLDAGKGEVVMQGATWAPGQPMVEIVKRVLRTPRGSYLMDSAFGIDMTWMQKSVPDAVPKLIAAIRQALSFYVSRGMLSSLQVTASQVGSVLTYDVSFLDPRDTLSNTQTKAQRVSGAF